MNIHLLELEKMRRNGYCRRKTIDFLLDRLADLLTVLLYIRVQEYSYERCRLLRYYAHTLEKLSLRNPRMRREKCYRKGRSGKK